LGRLRTGCTVLDCVLGGGWCEGRIANIVGDKSTGKTLLVIEACANFARQHPLGTIHYAEVEAAFDSSYAAALGFPVDRVRFVKNCFTVEDWFADLEATAKAAKQPALYVVDSLDALSDKAELERDLGEGSYGVSKAKKMGEAFRRIVQLLEEHQITVIIISQERDNIGVTFGKKSTRSGGRALDFYASQILWLHQIKRLSKTKGGIERNTGIMVKAKAEKNKAGLPFRECVFPLMFGFGIDDLRAGIEFLTLTSALDRISMTAAEADKLLKGADKLSDDDYTETVATVQAAVVERWHEIEAGFVPKRVKYR
jgi:recombination protein RecA